MLENPSVLQAGKACMGELSFLCTFCWQPQYPPARPKTIGYGTRIACKMCWNSILDLSICWVCGEIIVRGEEVVSLGWCFWHRGCFSCLICGYKLDPPTEDRENEESNTKPMYGDEISRFRLRNDVDYTFIDRAGLGETERRKGVELEVAPLCGWCETATAGCGQSEIQWNGYKNLTRYDSGLSKIRYIKKMGHIRQDRKRRRREKARLRHEKSRLRRKSKVVAKEQKEVLCQDHDPGFNTLLLNNTEDLAVGEDGHMDRTSNFNSLADSEGSIPSPIYLSLMDALGEPSFRASKTKPLPKWMTLQPSKQQELFDETYYTSLPRAPTPLSSLGRVGEEQAQCIHAVLEPSTPMTDTPCHEQTRTFVDNEVELRMSLDVDSDARGMIGLESAGLEEPCVGRTEYITSPCYQGTRLQRSGTPYPFKRPVSRPVLTLNIPKSSFSVQPSTTSITTTATPAIALKPDDESSKFCGKDERITDRLQRVQVEGADLGIGEEVGSGKDANYAAQAEYINRRDQLRKELLSLFNDRRRSSLED